MKTVYCVTFNSGDGQVFKLYSNARKALTFARQTTKTEGTLSEHTVELAKAKNWSNVYFYNEDDTRFTVSREDVQ